MAKRIVLFENEEDCCGCGACASSCPVSAITMTTDDLGNMYPMITVAKCVGCQRCLKVCAYKKRSGSEHEVKAYAALSMDEGLESNSASGGIFATMARSFLNNGGYIAGAVLDMDKSLKVHHILSNSENDLKKMQGSKYVQSNAWECYGDIKSKLKQGGKVLFCGTPCQVDAIKRLTGDPDNLLTIDLICHGVPASKMLDDYIKILGKELHGKITGVSFRDKHINKPFCSRIDLERGGKKKQYYMQSEYLSYYKYFLKGSIYRDSCYSCPYACESRCSDITIGDFWGLEKFHQNDTQGIDGGTKRSWSCILVNSHKGEEGLANYGSGIYLVDSKAEWVAVENHQLNHPSKKSEERAYLLELYRNEGYKGIEKYYRKGRGGAARYRWQLLKELLRNRRLLTINYSRNE